MSTDLQSRVFCWLDQHVRSESCLALGYSGGGDSHALLCLLTQWARRSGAPEIVALIVDHGLRPASADEAGKAAAAARRLGATARVLKWGGVKPASGIQAAARHARHELLAAAATDVGASQLLLAHTMDDQNETIWMRLQAGGGWRSCTGMLNDAPSPSWPVGRHVRLLRPLLNTRRTQLRAFLGDHCESWIEDPSNEDQRYTRIAVRKHLAALEANGFAVDRLTDLANELQTARFSESALAGRLADRVVELQSWGGARIDGALLEKVPVSITTQMLSATMLAVSGRRPPPSKTVVAAMLEALVAGTSQCGGGTRSVSWRGQKWLVRDLGALTGRVDQPTPGDTPIQSGRFNIWDGRYEIETQMSDICAGPLGSRYEGLEDRSILPDIPGAARPGLMAVRRTGSREVLAIAGCLQHPGVTIRSLARERLSSRLKIGAVMADDNRVETDVSTNELLV